MEAAKEVVYQIYPKSFQDTTGSGLGDLQGIIKHLDYLKDLGVTMLWLTPIYPSPQNDGGYDVADYCAIDPAYGTMEDFEELVAEAKKRGIGIMLDVVFNHTSTEHEWFKKAMEGDPKYKNYYIWKKGHDGKLPTNWESKFGGPVWEYVPKFDEYYLHLFDPTQADLNWENPEVREEVYKVLKFWLDKGVKGFRFDVINEISKGAYEDDFIGVGKRFYTDGPKVNEYLHGIYENCFVGQDILTVGEMSTATTERCAEYTKPENEELDMAFNFHHLKTDYAGKEKWTSMDFDFQELKELFNSWDVEMEEKGGWNALFWTCHDQPRALSRFGSDDKFRKQAGKMLGAVSFTRRGTPYIYQGEEIGMTDPGFTDLDQYRDVESLNAHRIMKEHGVPEEKIMRILSEKSRDNARTPMQWDAQGSFTTGTPWIEITPNQETINAEESQADPDSIYHYYQQLIELKKNSPVLQEGSTKPLLEDHPQIYAYRRVLGAEEMLMVHNFYGTDTRLPLEDIEEYDIVMSNYPDTQLKAGMTLRPYESLILKKK